MKNEYDFSKASKGKNPKELKVLKTIRIDADILEWLEDQAESQGMGYQTYLNWFLRKNMTETESIEERISKLEKAVFPKSRR